MSDVLDWAEKAAVENLKGRRENAEALAKECMTTLTVLLAGGTGALAFAANSLQTAVSWYGVGAAAFSVYLFAVATVLVWKPMRISELPALYNEPKHLYQPDFQLQQLREIELNNMQARIDAAVARNLSVGTLLNRIRLAAIASPLIAVAAAACCVVLPFGLAPAGG
ncbi:hypothetical protein GCM10007242_16460 [Pigmentiphaga litoralis]|uniref:hypothetical protein n=1 Tax=Pigmentiphaga litoralis TaxID=516702 RepID=UPI0019BD7AA0|nr:hypothetical protein [Pigmentiphaga litoralis]GGX11116.1 hypothetical protein GCM10007242_16460 [Pigmentiphaga litoralis]